MEKCDFEYSKLSLPGTPALPSTSGSSSTGEAIFIVLLLLLLLLLLFVVVLFVVLLLYMFMLFTLLLLLLFSRATLLFLCVTLSSSMMKSKRFVSAMGSLPTTIGCLGRVMLSKWELLVAKKVVLAVGPEGRQTFPKLLIICQNGEGLKWLILGLITGRLAPINVHYF